MNLRDTIMRFLPMLFLLTGMNTFHLQGAKTVSGNFEDSGYNIDEPLDLNSAAQLCSSLPITSIEGIWEYPDDEIYLLILKDKWEKGRYNVYVIDAVDCRLKPGMKIGEATESPDPLQFRLSLCSGIKKGVPGVAKDCLAKLNKNGEALYISSPKLKIVITPSILMPRLWNYLRLTPRVSVSNPVEKLPDGWRKIYPNYDGNGSSISSPRYL